MKLMIDGHLDLSWNALSHDRDQTLPVAELRKSEVGMEGRTRGHNTVSLPEMRRAGIGVCLATVICRAMPSDGGANLRDANVADIVKRTRLGAILRENLDFANQEICSAAARGQMAYYRILERRGQLRQIVDRAGLDEIWSMWTAAKSDAERAKLPIGYILSMEGADPILDMEDAGWWWNEGLRTACLAHYGWSAYAMGTGGDGPLTPRGRELLKRFNELGMILDLVHTSDSGVAEALDLFHGPVFVSHGNCRALVPGDRQFSDGQIKAITSRGGVVGVVMDIWMLHAGWRHNAKDNPPVALSAVADHIDHICQVAGGVGGVAIGSDLDGGFGTEQSPCDLDTIYDLHKLDPILRGRGYSEADVEAIFYGNWLRFFRESLPAGHVGTKQKAVAAR
ncbi:MAG: membrane dipeptidase [Planctomycetes bacterium]|nr:membrane dipeptidase [Planctomycetota bacterium]